MNILVTGGGGQLGRCLQQTVGTASDRYLFTDICEGYTHLDITNYEEICSFVEQEHIEAVVNCAAWTNVDAAETAPDSVYALNTLAAENLARAMQTVGGLLVHISTDYVFGTVASHTPLREDAPCCPTSVYGTTKWHAEQAIIATGVAHLILRTAWLYSEYGHNFVRTMLSLTDTREQLRVVADQEGTPTYAADLAAVIVQIISRRQYIGHSGIYHYTNEGATTWHAFACEIARLAHHHRCAVLPCTTADYPTPAVRPPYSVLDKTKIKETFGIVIPAWQEALARCLATIL